MKPSLIDGSHDSRAYMVCMFPPCPHQAEVLFPAARHLYLYPASGHTETLTADPEMERR